MRQVALLLHGLTDQDRSWLLGQLEPDQKDHVMDLLTELRELGMPADPGIAEKALSSASNDAHAVPVNPARDARDQLRAADASTIHRVLAGEPLLLVAMLLAAEPWPWTEHYLSMQEPAKAGRLVELAQDGPGGTVLRDQVLRAVATRLGDVPPVVSLPPTPRGYRLLRQVGAVLVPSLFKARA